MHEGANFLINGKSNIFVVKIACVTAVLMTLNSYTIGTPEKISIIM